MYMRAVPDLNHSWHLALKGFESNQHVHVALVDVCTMFRCPDKNYYSLSMLIAPNRAYFQHPALDFWACVLV